MDPIQSLRNLKLNSAFAPPWDQSNAMGIVNHQGDFNPMGNTQFDPFVGTQWGNWLDASGAGAPGGISIGSKQKKSDPLAGLKSAAPMPGMVTDPITGVVNRPVQR